MADRVVLHIGPRKTATTYLQRALQRLGEDGALPSGMYPTRTRGRLDHNQVPGLIDLARSLGEIALQEDAWQQQDGSYAQALLDHVRLTPGPVILSAEALSVMRDSGAQRIVEAFAPAPVDVIVTLRDLARILPSSWQQHVRNGNIEDYAVYLDLRMEERAVGAYRMDVGRAFWRAYRFGELVRRWQSAARSVCVVTVPQSSADPTLVWRRFREATGLAVELPEDPPDVPADIANISLSGAETYALHGYNVAAREQGLGRRDVRAIHRRLIRQGWPDARAHGPRLGIPAAFYPTAATWAAEDLEDLRRCEAPIHGSLDDLAVPPAASGGIPAGEDIAAAAGAALALLRRLPHDSADERPEVSVISIRGMDPDD